MAWYTTGTIAVSGTTVTGTGTNWLDNKQSIGAGQALLIPGSGTVKMYEIASVTSATKLTLKTSPGTIAAGQAYAILSFYTDSVPDFARRLAAQLSYYQAQMDGWQQIMTGTGSVTLTAPDGTSVTISSFSKLTSDIASAFQQRGNIGSNRDLNAMGPTSEFVGVWGISTTADLTGLTNSPESNGGELDIYPYGSYGCTQKLTTRYGNIWVRCPTANWTAANPDVWGAWCLVGSMYYSSNTKDMNALLTPVKYFSNNITNGPSGMTSTLYAFISVEVNTAMNVVKQMLEYSASGRVFTRYSNNGAWTAWAEIITSSDARLNTINGKSGGLINGSVTCDQPFNSTVSGNYGFVAATTAADATGQTARGMLIRGSSTQYDVQIHYRLVDLQYHCLRLIQNSTEIFRANSNGACYAVSFNPTSDSRLKFNKRFIGDALSKSMTLRGMTYQIQGEEKAGVIAQDVLKVMPQAVTQGGEELVLESGERISDQLSLDYAGVTALNTEALKDVVKLMLECLTDPDSARAKLTKLVDAINASTDDANETEMRMEWALVNQPETPPEQPVTDSANADS